MVFAGLSLAVYISALLDNQKDVLAETVVLISYLADCFRLAAH
jgi:hypothetical protein